MQDIPTVTINTWENKRHSNIVH